MKTVNSVTDTRLTRVRAGLAATVGAAGLAVLAAHPALADRSQVYALAIGVVAAGFGWSLWWTRQGQRPAGADPNGLPARGVVAAAAAVLGAAAMSVACNRQATLLALWPLAAQLLLAAVACWVAGERRARRWLGAALAAGTAVTSVYATAQFLGWDPLPPATPFAVQRVVGPFANPNDLGNVLAAALPLVLALLLGRAGSLEAPAGHRAAAPVAALLVLTYLGLLLSASRGAWMAALAGVGLVLAGWALEVRRRHGRWPWRWLVGCAVAMAAVTALVQRQPVVREPNRLVSLSQRARSTGLILEPLVRERGAGAAGRPPAPMAHDTAINHRYFIWQVALSMVRAHPLTGVGFGEFGRRFPEFRDALADREIFRTLNEVAQTEFTPYAHNEYLHVWAESGLPGLLSLLVLFGLGSAQALRAVWQSAHARPVVWGLLGLVAAMLTHSLVSYPLRLPANGLLFWTAFGVLLGHARPPGCPRQPGGVV